MLDGQYEMAMGDGNGDDNDDTLEAGFVSTGEDDPSPWGAGDKTKGACLSTVQEFNPNNLGIIRDFDKSYLTYLSDKRFYLKSDQWVGEARVYLSKLENGGPCILVKKSDIMERVREELGGRLKTKVKFYGKDESAYIGCYAETTKNSANIQCINAVRNGQPVLLPIEQLERNTWQFTAFLRSGGIKKSNKIKDETLWSLTIVELVLQKPRPESINCNKPLIRFARSFIDPATD